MVHSFFSSSDSLPDACGTGQEQVGWYGVGYKKVIIAAAESGVILTAGMTGSVRTVSVALISNEPCEKRSGVPTMQFVTMSANNCVALPGKVIRCLLDT